MFRRFHPHHSNLQELGHLSKSCPAMDGPAENDSKDTDSSGSSASLSDPFSESSEEITPPVSRAEKLFARQSVRRARQREMEQKRNIEENKISMDDYLGKQTQFRLWLQEEQKKEAKDLSSPKRKTYFKMFVRLWNKRHLPAKYYESRLSRHMADENKAPEEKSPAHPDRPKFSLLQNSPALDPTIFPHSIDLSSDSIVVGTPSSFSTFGKSTPSSKFTPVRFSADCGKTSRQTPSGFKRLFRFGENKENAITALAEENLRTATISPHKKMMSSCQERSLDRMVVSWSPRGQPKLNPVDCPRCPAPFQHAITEQPSTPELDRMESLPGSSAEFSSVPGFSQEYHQVKDSLGNESPTYVEIPVADSPCDSQSYQGQRDEKCIGSMGRITGGKVYRRRSRSVDEIPVYAVPSKDIRETRWQKEQTEFKKEVSLSPPPVPPKRFDPHVEGLGVPFSPATTKRNITPSANVEQPHSNKIFFDETACGKEATKKSGKILKGFPWFGRKMTSRRRSRSCETLSISSQLVPTESNTVDQFPLVELERSPTFGRRALTRTEKPTNRGVDKSLKSTFVLTEYASSPMRRLDKPTNFTQKEKFKLTEYSASPMRLDKAGTLSKKDVPTGILKKGTPIRRRSRSLEQISSPFLDSQLHQNTVDTVTAHHQIVQSDRKELEENTVGSDDMHKPSSCVDSAPASLSKNLSMSPATVSFGGETEHHSTSHCDIYEQVKSDVKQELSSLVQKIQQLSAPEESADLDYTTPMEVEELQSSPKRFGQKENLENDSINKEVQMTMTNLEDPNPGGSLTNVPNSQDDALLETVGETESTANDTVSISKQNIDMKHSTVDALSSIALTSQQKEHSTASLQYEEKVSNDEAAEAVMAQELLNGLGTFKTNSEEAVMCEPLPEIQGKSSFKHSVIENVPEVNRSATTVIESEKNFSDPTVTSEQLKQLFEVQHHREIVKNPVVLEELAFSEPVLSVKHSSVCKALTPAASGGGQNLMTSTMKRCRERRRSRSVDETFFSKAVITFQNDILPDPVKTQASLTMSVTSNMHTFTPSLPGLDNTKCVDLQNSKSVSVEDSHSSEVSCGGADLLETPANEHIMSAPSFCNDKSKKQGSSQKMHQSQSARCHEDKQQQELSPRVSHQNPDLKLSTCQHVPMQLSQETPLKHSPSVEENWHLMSKPKSTLQTATKQAPPVMQKPRLQYPLTPQNCQSEPSVEVSASPPVTAIQQKFGGSFRSTMPRNRRRSRSVGDVSVFTDQNPVSHPEGGSGFASVHAFWNHMRDKTGETNRPIVNLQRKPSTMKRLQQQLYGKKLGSSGVDEVSHRLDKQPILATRESDSSSQSYQSGENQDQSKSDLKAKKSSGKSCEQGTMDQEITPISKVNQEMLKKQNDKMPIQKSPFVTVRRQSSRKLNTGSPCARDSTDNGTGTNSPHIKDGQNKQSVPDMADITDDENVDVKSKAGNNLFNVPQKQSTTVHISDVTCTSSAPIKSISSENEESLSGVIKEVYVTHTQKKKPLPPPKTLPKPTIRRLPASMVQSPLSTNKQMLVLGKTRKRHSQETDETGVPEKVSAVTEDHENREPVTRSASRCQTTFRKEDNTQKKTCSPAGNIGTIRSTKRRSQDKLDDDVLSAAKRSSSATAHKETLTGGTQQDGGKEPRLKRNLPMAKRTNSGKESKVCSPHCKSQNMESVSKTDSSSTKRQSSGKDLSSRAVTPRRSSGVKRTGSVSRSDSTRIQASNSGIKPMSSRVQRRSSGRGRSKTVELEQGGKNKMSTQGNHTEEIAQPSCMEKQYGSTKHDEKSAMSVKRFNSVREETKSQTASSLIKRFNSLKDETRSSRLKRRSGGGSRASPVVKCTSTGNGKTRRESGKVKRTDSSRQAAGQQYSEDTISRSGSFRKHGAKPPQSPTFMRITHRLGICEDDNNDDDIGEGVAGNSQAQKVSAGIEKVKSHSTGDKDHHNKSSEVRAGNQSTQHQASTTKCNREKDINDMETDIDSLTNDSEPYMEGQRDGNSTGLSTMV